MLKNPLVSIILPIYNMEKYLVRAIDSAINQTYSNIEIILVNDGSIDNSDKICDGYSEQYNRIKVIHQKNAGVSNARNVGIKMAKGDYIQFMDPDDCYDLSITEKLVSIALENKSDLVICGINLLTVKGEKIISSQDKTLGKSGCYTNTEIFKAYYSRDLLVSGCIGHSCNKLYSNKLIKDYKLAFDEKILVNEDNIFNMIYISKCNKIHYLNQQLYNQHSYDRITGSSRYWANAYEDSKYLFEIIRKGVEGNITETEINIFENSYANKMITAVVILCRPDTIYTNKQLFLKLKTIVNDKTIQNSLKYYKRSSRNHSILIPLFMKLKLPLLLLWVAKYRAIKRYSKLINETKKLKMKGTKYE